VALSYVERARALVGTKFRPQGRGAEGVDCVGLVLAAYGLHPACVRANYRLRGDHRLEMEQGLRRHFRRLADGRSGPGDVLLLQPREDLLHLAIQTDRGFVHAHAGIGRVVETPGEPNWPILGVFRKKRAANQKG
jgi:hypothetical protein